MKQIPPQLFLTIPRCFSVRSPTAISEKFILEPYTFPYTRVWRDVEPWGVMFFVSIRSLFRWEPIPQNSGMDSLWLQRKPGFLFEDTLNLADTSQFIALVDTLEFLTKLFPRYYEEGWLYKEEEDPLSYERRYYYIVNDADSFYFVYRKDSSYFAYCQMLQSRNCGSFQLQCIFQTDSLPYFPAFDVAPYPYPSWSSYWISSNSPKDQYHSGSCLSKEDAMALKANALPPRRGAAPKNVEGKSYRTNGCPNSGNHSGIVIENGKAKFQRKK